MTTVVKLNAPNELWDDPVHRYVVDGIVVETDTSQNVLDALQSLDQIALDDLRQTGAVSIHTWCSCCGADDWVAGWAITPNVRDPHDPA